MRPKFQLFLTVAFVGFASVFLTTCVQSDVPQQQPSNSVVASSTRGNDRRDALADTASLNTELSLMVSATDAVRSVAYIDVFQTADAAGDFPQLIESIQMGLSTHEQIARIAVPEGSVLEIQAYLRRCAESCDAGVLLAPSNGCATEFKSAIREATSLNVTFGQDRPCKVSGATVAATVSDAMQATNLGTGEPDCDPQTPHARSTGLPIAVGFGTGLAEVWAMLWAEPPFPVDQEIKMVFRVTGTGRFDVEAFNGGSTLRPSWGPNEHERTASSFLRRGEEWGTAFVFSEPGCWTIRVTRGTEEVDFWFPVQ